MQFAFEGAELDGKPPASHFVRALTHGLQTGEADSNGDGRITVDELANYLQTKLKTMGSPQRPSKWTFGAVGGDLLFACNPRATSRVLPESVNPLRQREQLETAMRNAANQVDLYVKAGLRYQNDLEQAAQDPEIMRLDTEVKNCLFALLMHFPEKALPEYQELAKLVTKANWATSIQLDKAWEIRHLLFSLASKYGDLF